MDSRTACFLAGEVCNAALIRVRKEGWFRVVGGTHVG